MSVEGSNPFARSNLFKGFLNVTDFWHGFDPPSPLSALRPGFFPSFFCRSGAFAPEAILSGAFSKRGVPRKSAAARL